MKIQIHPTTLEGKPIHGQGPVYEGSDATEVVELMRYDTPFTLAQTPSEYRNAVLDRVEGQERPALPDSAPEADVEFLTRLAQRGFIRFMPEGAPVDLSANAPDDDEDPKEGTQE